MALLRQDNRMGGALCSGIIELYLILRDYPLRTLLSTRGNSTRSEPNLGAGRFLESESQGAGFFAVFEVGDFGPGSFLEEWH